MIHKLYTIKLHDATVVAISRLEIPWKPEFLLSNSSSGGVFFVYIRLGILVLLVVLAQSKHISLVPFVLLRIFTVK